MHRLHEDQRRLLESLKRAEELARTIAVDSRRDAASGHPEAQERAQRAKEILDRAVELRAQVEVTVERAMLTQAQAADQVQRFPQART